MLKRKKKIFILSVVLYLFRKLNSNNTMFDIYTTGEFLQEFYYYPQLHFYESGNEKQITYITDHLQRM